MFQSENDNLYLRIASQALARMKRGEDEIANAAVCVAFSAFAVEYCIKRLVHVRLYLGPYGRRAELAAAMPRRNRRSLRHLFDFVRAYSSVPTPLLAQGRAIFKHRNSLVHSTAIKGTVTPDGTEEERKVTFHVIGPEMIPVASDCLDTAERLVAALRAASFEKSWNPF